MPSRRRSGLALAAACAVGPSSALFVPISPIHRGTAPHIAAPCGGCLRSSSSSSSSRCARAGRVALCADAPPGFEWGVDLDAVAAPQRGRRRPIARSANASRAVLKQLNGQLASARTELQQQREDGQLQAYVPGLLLAAALAKLANELGAATGFSPFLWASVVGMVAGNFITVASPSSKRRLDVGVNFVKSRLLRAGIVMYGAKLTLQQLALSGWAGALADLSMSSSTILLGWAIGTQVLRLSPSLTVLISSGAAICGCSAVAATQSVVEGEAHEVTAAIGSVVMCSTALMFLYPLLFKFVPSLASNPRLMGIFTGATVHEVAGVVAVGNSIGNADVAATALVTKIVRVCFLAPFLLMLSGARDILRLPFGRKSASRKVALPWFALGLFAVAGINSVVPLPPVVVKGAGTISATLVAMAMAATGVDADLRKIVKLGPRPMILAVSLLAHLVFTGGFVARLLVQNFPA